MTSPLRFMLSTSVVLAALLVAGCASTPGSSAPTSVPDPAQSQAPSVPDSDDDIEAAWLDDGRMFAVVTWGSSTCVPTVESASADGQTVTVELNQGDADQPCTDDLVARASLGSLPEGVDPTEDIELIVTLGDRTDDVDLDGNAALTGIPGSETEYRPSAGWFDDDALVLLTWGSSGCPPIVEDVQASGSTGTVTFATEDRVCTMDMAPRATIISFDEEDDDGPGDDDDDDDIDDDADFVLTLVGDNLDATVTVMRG